MRAQALRLTGFAGTLTLLALLLGPPPVTGYVTLLEIEPGSPGDAAGLHEGDVLGTWWRGTSRQAADAQGTFAEPFDLVFVGLEQPPLGPMHLVGHRADQPFEIEVPFGPWSDFRAAPLLTGERRTAFATALLRWQEGEHEEALRQWIALAASEASDAAPRRRIWWSFLLAERARDAGLLNEAENHYQTAVATAVETGQDVALEAFLRRELGALLLEYLGRNDDAERELRLAYDLRRGQNPRSFAVDDSLEWLGEVPRFAQRYHESLQVAEERLDLIEALAPGSYPHGDALADAAYLYWRLGDYVTAEALYNQAFAIARRATWAYQNPGLVVLAYIARARGEEERYHELIQRDIDWRLRVDDPGQQAIAHSYAASLAADDGDLEQAEAHDRAALEIRRRMYADTSHPVAASIGGLGILARRRGDFDRAQELLEQALELFEQLAPSGASSADILGELGQLAEARGRAGEAEQRYRAAIRIGDRVAPATEETANAHYRLALLLCGSGRLSQAVTELEAATRALEAQTRRLGGSDERRVGFAARHGHFYRDLLAAYLQLGEPARAFAVLERSRARQLLELLYQRDLDWRAEVSPRLAADLAGLEREVDSTFVRLHSLAAADPQVDELLAALENLAARRRILRDRLAAEAPRIAAVRFPEPLDLGAAQATLDPGTLLLSYSVGPETTTLFALGPGRGELRTVTVSLGQEELSATVVRWRRDLERVEPMSRSQRRTVVGELSRHLLGGVADLLARSDRLLVVPDGPLHVLSFAALDDPVAGAAPERRLIERLPITYAPSVSVLAELRRSAPAHDRRASLVAFGDPLYAAAEPAAAQLAALERGGFELVSLPATRREVEAVAALFPDRAMAWTGAEATEERAKAVGRSANLVHFACHARIDERFPLDSALVLALPQPGEPRRDNGLLQTWEIFDQLHLDADLVTLSACDTGLGTVVTGEGILGLTRAFHYAGARAVLASLWRISDESTAELMRRFYRGLAAGLVPAAALQRAQLELLSGPIAVVRGGEPLELDFSDPYHWAAFRLSGQ